MGYIPDRGDLVWINFSPHLGHEQGGKRPALVLSPRAYNKKTGLALFCPLTSRQKGYPFEVTIDGSKLKGVLLSDHVRNLDWRKRQVKFIEKAPDETTQECLAKIEVLLRG